MRFSRLVVGVVASVLLCASASVAQDAPGDYLYVVTVEVKPGMNADFEEYIKQVQSAARPAPERVVAYQRVMGGSNNTYYFAIRFDEWGDLDGWHTVPQMLVNAHGEAEAATLLASGAGAVLSISTTVSQMVPGFSSAPGAPSSSPPAYGHVIRTQVDPSLSAQYEHLLRTLKVAEDQAGVGITRRVSRQGETLTHTSVRLYNNHAERDGWASAQRLLADAYGEDEARTLFASQAEAVKAREIYTLRMRPDLSRIPEATNNQ